MKATIFFACVSIFLTSAIGTPTAKPSISPQGTCHVVALFAKFPDEDPAQTTPPAYAQDLFNPDVPGSFTHFYNEMSLGKFTAEGIVLPTYYSSDRPASGYPLPENDADGYFGTFNREVLQNADRDVDFGSFDNDGPDGLPNSGDDDGCVDFIFVIVKSNPPGFFPGGATGIARLGLEKEFITNDPASSGHIKITCFRGATQRVWNFTSAVGIMTHEFGHALGLPDLYDLSYEGPEDDGAGIGCWGLMGRGALGWNGHDGPADGPVPFCAWSREQLGWTNVVEITEDVVGQVWTDAATTGTVYKIPLGEEGNYYLLENRQSAKSHYDRNILRDGLLIWRIQPWMGNRDESNKMVDLVCADGLYLDRGYPDGTMAAPDSGRDNLDFWAHDKAYRSAHAGNLGDATDVFDGVQFTAFTPHTNPKSEGGTWVEHIRRRGTDLIADIRVPKWSGTITEDVTWEGVVNVGGDIVVQEGAILTIHPGTVVRFSPTDALQGGADPSRCEVDVFGVLNIGRSGEDPVRFTTEGKGTWLGIRLHDTASIRMGTEPDRIRVEDCDHPQGVFWSPEHLNAKGPKLFECIVQDNGKAGNGDGMLNPGETVQLVLDIRNWTMMSFRVGLSTDDPFVTDRETPPRHSLGTVIPGRTERLAGFFAVASDCPDGYSVSFNVAFKRGTETWTDTFSLPVEGTRVLVTDIEEVSPLHALPISFALGQNVPNPFNAETLISFDLPRPVGITLTIFNAVGQAIQQWQGSWSTGHHTLTWNGEDEDGIPVASGVYFYRLEAERFVGTRRMMLLR